MGMLLSRQEGQRMFSNQDGDGHSRRLIVRRAAVALGVAAAFAVAGSADRMNMATCLATMTALRLGAVRVRDLFRDSVLR
jgi:hypothetical protein